MSASETSAMLETVVRRALADHGDWQEPPRFAAGLWSAFDEIGLFGALRDTGSGGAGLTPVDLLGTLMALGEHAVPAPVADALAAQWLASSAGLAPVDGIAVVATAEDGWTVVQANDEMLLGGVSAAAPWGEHAQWLIASLTVLDTPYMVRLPVAAAQTAASRNLAGEPCLSFAFAGLPLSSVECGVTDSADRAAMCAAAFRSAQIAGALALATALSVGYARERIQFGRPIGSFQAVQQLAAELETQRIAAEAAAALGLGALSGPSPASGVAIAKARCGEAATLGSALAHQIHGAMGCTLEYPLQAVTRRLWDWRDAFGSEHQWAARLGEAAARDADNLWDFIRAEFSCAAEAEKQA